MHFELWSNNEQISTVAINLNGTNFVSWKRNVIHTLVAKNKLGFFDGSIAKPNSISKDINRWMRWHYLITCWLVNSMLQWNKKSVRISHLLKVLINYAWSIWALWSIKWTIDISTNERSGEIDARKYVNCCILFERWSVFWDELQNLRNFQMWNFV